MKSGNTDFEVIIAGGGMVGSSLALALATLDLDVAVVEAVERGAPAQPSFDDRSTALSRSSQRLYTALGFWDDIVAASTPITSIHVSDKGRFGFSHIDAEEQGVEALGYVVINRVLGGVLQAGLDAEPRIQSFCPARIVAADARGEAAQVEMETASGERRSLSSKLLVAADGARSNVRDMLGISATFTDYGQHAVIGNLLTERPHQNRAWERFTEDGPIAMLPIRDDRTAFVWILPEALSKSVQALDDAAFLERLHGAFGNRLGGFSRIGRRSAYPLSLSKASSLVAGRGVLIGNAAHGLHPVAAQGFNLGLRDVAALSDCIFDAADGGNPDPGSVEVLERYAEWRRADQKKLVGFTDGLVRLFGSELAPVKALRDVGMLGFDLVPGVRRLFARHTMGLAGRLPRLSRGVPLS